MFHTVFLSRLQTHSVWRVPAQVRHMRGIAAAKGVETTVTDMWYNRKRKWRRFRRTAPGRTKMRDQPLRNRPLSLVILFVFSVCMLCSSCGGDAWYAVGVVCLSDVSSVPFAEDTYMVGPKWSAERTDPIAGDMLVSLDLAYLWDGQDQRYSWELFGLSVPVLGGEPYLFFYGYDSDDILKALFVEIKGGWWQNYTGSPRYGGMIGYGLCWRRLTHHGGLSIELGAIRFNGFAGNTDRFAFQCSITYCFLHE